MNSMFTSDGLTTIRRAYAKQVLFAADVCDPHLERAFAEVRREEYLGAGPWQVFRWNGYAQTPSDEPAYLYSDILVGLAPDKGLNNGQPSGHARWIAAAAPSPGERIAHIGAGTGYYTAILAELVGAPGTVVAIEYESELAALARKNLSGRPNVGVIQGDGSTIPLGPTDLVYVNAGATHPAETWLDALADGGRLVLPLTGNISSLGAQSGAVFLITREGDDFRAKWISPTAFYPCQGLRDPVCAELLTQAFARGRAHEVSRLIRHGDAPEDQCWIKTKAWSLCFS